MIVNDLEIIKQPQNIPREMRFQINMWFSSCWMYSLSLSLSFFLIVIRVDFALALSRYHSLVSHSVHLQSVKVEESFSPVRSTFFNRVKSKIQQQQQQQLSTIKKSPKKRTNKTEIDTITNEKCHCHRLQKQDKLCMTINWEWERQRDTWDGDREKKKIEKLRDR